MSPAMLEHHRTTHWRKRVRNEHSYCNIANKWRAFFAFLYNGGGKNQPVFLKMVQGPWLLFAHRFFENFLFSHPPKRKNRHFCRQKACFNTHWRAYFPTRQKLWWANNNHTTRSSGVFLGARDVCPYCSHRENYRKRQKQSNPSKEALDTQISERQDLPYPTRV